MNPGTAQDQVALRHRNFPQLSTLAVLAIALNHGLTSGVTTAGPTPPYLRNPSAPARAPVQAIAAAAKTPESIAPGENIQIRVNAAPPGATFLLKSGLHRLQTIVPRNGDTFLGETGTVLSGARQLVTFTRSGSCWLTVGQTVRSRGAPGDAPGRSGYPRCNYPEDLFLNDVPLLNVARLSDVGPGKWHCDYAADRIYLGDDPTGKKVEVSVTPKAFTGSATDVTIRNLTIEKYANPTQQATVELGTGWIIEDCELRGNHFTGISVGPRSIARRNHVHHNGCFGFHGAGEHILVANNEIAYNGFAGYDPFWGSGGSKWVYTSHLVVRGNFSHHNRGPGLWTDINNIHTLYENNTVEDNERGGIFHEISYDATIRNNTSRRNGTGKDFPYWTTGAGIEIVSSRNVEVYGNTLEDNWQGITGLDDHRGTGNAGPYTLINLHVHDNIVTSRIADDGGGRTGVIDTKGMDAFAAAANNRFRQNVYSLGSKRPYFVWLGKELDETEWRRYGQDESGTFRRWQGDSSPQESIMTPRPLQTLERGESTRRVYVRNAKNVPAGAVAVGLLVADGYRPIVMQAVSHRQGEVTPFGSHLPPTVVVHPRAAIRVGVADGEVIVVQLEETQLPCLASLFAGSRGCVGED